MWAVSDVMLEYYLQKRIEQEEEEEEITEAEARRESLISDHHE